MVFSFLKKNKRLTSRDLGAVATVDPCSGGQYKRRRSPTGREVEAADTGGQPSSVEASVLKFTDWESSNPVITLDISSGLNLTSDTLKRLRRQSSQQALNKCVKERDFCQSTLSIAPLKVRGRPRPESCHLGRSLLTGSIPSFLLLPSLTSPNHPKLEGDGRLELTLDGEENPEGKKGTLLGEAGEETLEDDYESIHPSINAQDDGSSAVVVPEAGVKDYCHVAKPHVTHHHHHHRAAKQEARKRLFLPLPAEDDSSLHLGQRCIQSLPGEGTVFTGKRQPDLFGAEAGYGDYSDASLLDSLNAVEGAGEYSGKRLFHPHSIEQNYAEYTGRRQIYPSYVYDETVGEYGGAGKRLFHSPCEEGGGADYCAGKRLFHEEGGHYYESDSGVSSLYEPVSFPARLDSQLEEADSQLGTLPRRYESNNTDLSCLETLTKSFLQVASLPSQLAAIFTGCPDHTAKLTYLTDILDLEHVIQQVHVAGQRQHVGPGYRHHSLADSMQLSEDYASVMALTACGGRDGLPAPRNPLTARYLAALLTKELAERCEILNWQLSLVWSEKSENARDIESRLLHKLQAPQMDEIRSLCHVVETSTRLLLALAGKLAAADRRCSTMERDRPGSRDQLMRRLEEAAALKRYADRRTRRLAAKFGDTGCGAVLQQFVARQLGLVLKADDILDQLRHMERQREALHILFVR